MKKLLLSLLVTLVVSNAWALEPDNEVAKWLVDNCRKSQEQMVKIEDDESVEVFPISPLPKKAAIVIDKNTASSAESLIRFAKMCCDPTRTKVYGKENTWGAQYSGNIIGTPLPNSQIWVYYPTCVSSLFLQGESKYWMGLSKSRMHDVIPQG